MAEVPKYGRVVSPPGPSGYVPQGRLFDVASAVWAQTTGEMGAQLAQTNERIRTARDTTQILSRTARFSLDMQNLVGLSQQLTVGEGEQARAATAQERLAYFQEQAELLRGRALNYEGGSIEAKTRLNGYITDAFTQHLVQFQRHQQKAELANVAEEAMFTLQAAIATGDETLAREALNDLETVEVITPAAHAQALKDFPVDVQIEKLRQGAQVSPEETVQTATQMLTGQDISDKQREALREVIRTGQAFGLAVKQREAALQEKNGRELVAAIWSGKFTDPAEITKMLDAGEIDLAIAKFARSELTEARPEISDWLALGNVRDAIVKLKASGDSELNKQQALQVFYDNEKRLSKTDAQSMFNRIYEDYEALQASTQGDSQKIIDELVRDKAELTGLFTDDRNQILGAAKAKMLLDQAIRNAIAAEKPLQGMDLKLAAIDIGTAVRAEVDAAEKMKTQIAAPTPEQFTERKQLTVDVAIEYLRRANGDRDKARRMAEADGYTE